MSKGAEHGLEPVLVNYRGGGPLQKPLWSGPTLTSDLKEVLAILRARHPDTVFVGFGCSVRGIDSKAFCLGTDGVIFFCILM